jgi:hypothetical protein
VFLTTPDAGSAPVERASISAAGNVNVQNLTASKAVFTDASKNLTSTGTLGLDQGGTGVATAQGAINALAGSVTSGSYLRGNGTNVVMSTIQVADVPTLNQNTTGSAGSLSANSTYMVSRGSVAEASVDTATSNGFYIQNNTSDSDGLLVFAPGGSLGTFQLHAKYTGLLRFRNRTDNTTWNSWKTVLHDGNYNSYSPTLTGTGASGTWSISVSGNAATVTNGVYTNGSYANPSWITSLSETKVLPSQTGHSGKYLTTNGTSTSWGTAASTGKAIAMAIVFGG